MKIGEPCPKIAFNNQHGNPIPFSDIIGSKNIVFFFYPKILRRDAQKRPAYFETAMPNFSNTIVRLSAFLQIRKNLICLSQMYSI